MLDDKDEFDNTITLEDVRRLITEFEEQEKHLIRLNAQRSGTEMLLDRLRELETLLARRERNAQNPR